MTYHRRSDCRSCGSEDLHYFLSLGPTPLANSFLRSPEDFENERTYPLDLCYCDRCSLVQIPDVVDPEVLFRDYIYVTGTSSTIAQHNVGYARTVVDLLGLGSDDLVIEVASNDGSLLQRFQDHGVRTLGVEPATNVAAMATAAGVDTVNRFFGQDAGRELRAEYGPARAVIGNNVLAHVDDTLGFLRGFRSLLADDGLAILEVPYLTEFIERLEYDTVYHEHLCYFSIRSLMRLCETAGLRLVRVDRVPVHGGSIRIYAAPDTTVPHHAESVVAMCGDEDAAGLGDRTRYDRFARDVHAQRDALRSMLRQLQDEGLSLAGYGAPAKGNTLLNFCGISRESIPYTVDRSPLKIGTYTPGSHIPVLDVDVLLERQPDIVVILAWNFADEIMAQQREYRERGGRFLLPLPQPRLV